MSTKYQQFAAIPFRESNGQLEILLITSRQTKSWITPKGWPSKKLKPFELAALESYEEAGIEGVMGKNPIGHFEYSKNLKDGSQVLCDVDVFPLRVEKELMSWPEQKKRTRRWVSKSEAVKLVRDKGLAALIDKFDPGELSFDGVIGSILEVG